LRSLLFGEAQGRVVVSTPDPAAVIAIATRHGIPARAIGKVGDREGTFAVRVGERMMSTPIARLATTYHGAIPVMMTRVATATDEEPALTVTQ
jgi:phosphoribosylformylglycinamidine synthase